MVAGVPMMNGSRSLEGFVPIEDATVVTRVLDAGAHRRRQGGLRGPVLLRRQPHRRQRARCATPGTPPGPRAARRAAAPRWSRPARSTWPSAATRAARSACRLVVRHRRAQADLRAGPLHRRLPDRGDARPPRPDGAHRARRRRCCSTASPARTGWTRGRPAAPSGVDYTAGLDGGVAGLRVGVLREGFGGRRAVASRRSTRRCGGRRSGFGEPARRSSRSRCPSTLPRCTSGT